jgi:diguanylate cyclase (GGDEF)-like protein
MMAVYQTGGDTPSLVELREISILFAEDDVAIRTHVSRLLTPVCGELYTAENGRIALELFKKKIPDLVLTDISMPGMNGLELARQVKLKRPDVPVIIISSHDDSEHLMQAIDLQLEGYLTKPLNVQKLFALLQQQALLLRTSRLANQQTRLLSGVNMAIQYLLSADANQDAVDFALQEMVKAAKADKIFLYHYQDSVFGDRDLVMISGFAGGDLVLRFLDGIDPDVPELPYVERWYSLLSQGKSISGPRSAFPAEERHLMDAMRVRSMLLTPIFEDGSLWGFACLCDMKRERPWSDAETSMIMTAARGLGSFMGRLKLEDERREARKSLELANVQWRETFDTIPDMVMVLDQSHQIVNINKAARDRLSIGESGSGSLIGPCFQHIHGASHPPEGCPHSALLQDHQSHETEVFISHMNSYFHISVNPTFDADGNLVGAVHVARDVTKRREMEDRLRYLSTHDEMTKLYNRAFFEAEVEQIEKGRTAPISVVIADLDGLKEANDCFGHDFGDGLIRAAADLLREIFRSGDAIARIGGDEFAVILKGVGEELLATIMERAREMLEHGGHLSEQGLKVRFSLGCATTGYPSRLQETIRAADMAMYEDKKTRKQKEIEL